MKILVVGNCQVRPLANCLRELLPGADTRDLWLSNTQSAEAKAVEAEIGDFDVVCSHPRWEGPFKFSDIKHHARKLVTIPPIAFTGFHPDDLVISSVRGPLGPNQSAIIVISYLLELSETRCARLFNAFIYASLGYFARFDEARALLMQRTKQLGLPIDRCMESWPRPFMYDVQHPKFEPLASLAELMAGQITDDVAQIEWANSNAAEQFREANYVAWPLYPEIAVRLGLPAEEMRFRYPHKSVGLDLQQFIAHSYSVYATSDRAVLAEAVKTELPILRNLVRTRVVAGGRVEEESPAYDVEAHP